MARTVTLVAEVAPAPLTAGTFGHYSRTEGTRNDLGIWPSMRKEDSSVVRTS
jgi:hypothetical protein